MRVITETKELTHSDLRLLSEKTGKSVKNLKRLKKTHSYLAYTSTSENAYYAFFGRSDYKVLSYKKSVKDFFRVIQVYQLSQIL